LLTIFKNRFNICFIKYWVFLPLNLNINAQIIYLRIKIKHHLNYSKKRPNYTFCYGKYLKLSFSLLFVVSLLNKFSSPRNSKMIMDSKGIKIILTVIFFNKTIEFVAQELKRNKNIKKTKPKLIIST
jgi:hypothetical protein